MEESDEDLIRVYAAKHALLPRLPFMGWQGDNFFGMVNIKFFSFVSQAWSWSIVTEFFVYIFYFKAEVAEYICLANSMQLISFAGSLLV